MSEWGKDTAMDKENNNGESRNKIAVILLIIAGVLFAADFITGFLSERMDITFLPGIRKIISIITIGLLIASGIIQKNSKPVKSVFNVIIMVIVIVAIIFFIVAKNFWA